MPSPSLTFASFFYFHDATCFLVSYSLNREYSDTGKAHKRYRAEIYKNIKIIHTFYAPGIDQSEACKQLEDITR